VKLSVTRTIIVASLTQGLTFLLFAALWPKEVKPLDIPTGKVEYIAGTKMKGIVLQGTNGGLSLWYLISTQPRIIVEGMK